MHSQHAYCFHGSGVKQAQAGVKRPLVSLGDAAPALHIDVGNISSLQDIHSSAAQVPSYYSYDAVADQAKGAAC